MIFYRKNNGEMGQVTYGDLEIDLTMLENRLELRQDIVRSISKFQSLEEHTAQKPVTKSSFMVLVV